jgi:hypothetical protein
MVYNNDMVTEADTVADAKRVIVRLKSTLPSRMRLVLRQNIEEDKD